jgi:hypothetical protein
MQSILVKKKKNSLSVLLFFVQAKLCVPRTNAAVTAASNVECYGHRLRWFYKGYKKFKGKAESLIIRASSAIIYLWARESCEY